MGCGYRPAGAASVTAFTPHTDHAPNVPLATKPMTLAPLALRSSAGIVSERSAVHFLAGPACSVATVLQLTSSRTSPAWASYSL